MNSVPLARPPTYRAPSYQSNHVGSSCPDESPSLNLIRARRSVMPNDKPQEPPTPDEKPDVEKPVRPPLEPVRPPTRRCARTHLRASAEGGAGARRVAALVSERGSTPQLFEPRPSIRACRRDPIAALSCPVGARSPAERPLQSIATAGRYRWRLRARRTCLGYVGGRRASDQLSRLPGREPMHLHTGGVDLGPGPTARTAGLVCVLASEDSASAILGPMAGSPTLFRERCDEATHVGRVLPVRGEQAVS